MFCLLTRKITNVKIREIGADGKLFVDPLTSQTWVLVFQFGQ